MFDSFHIASGFTSETSLSSSHQPRTPPDTPFRAHSTTRPRHHSSTNNRRRRFSRPDSPGSSVHPTETSSPAKKAAKRAANDNVQVQELEEGDAGYQTDLDLDVVYPEELEEVGSSDQGDDELSSGTDDEGGHSDTTTGLSRRMSRLSCGDPNATTKFEQSRRLRRMSKRMEGRSFKRSHSESLKGEGSPEPMSADMNADAMDDHDRVDAQRRLRRRTQGPEIETLLFEDMPRSSPDPSGYVSARSRVRASTEPLTPESEIRWKGKGRVVKTDDWASEAARAGAAMDLDAMDVDAGG